jgi:dTDP-4-dehydrorhamnose reductase
LRVLVFGGTGMLGRAVAAEGRRRGAPVLALSRQEADLSDASRLAYWVASFRPDAVVNCAAFTRVDDCEIRRDQALAVNAAGVAHVVEVIRPLGLPLLQVSTDYVFDGTAREPYSEDAPVRPLSVYGESKLLGERAALAYERALVVRTSWLFGHTGASFPAAILGKLAAGERRLRVVDDQVGCPTFAPFLARALWDLLPRGLTGLLHYRNREPVSWYGFACEIARATYPGAEVVPVATVEYPRPAPRPGFSVLNVARFEAIVGRPVEAWGWGLAELLATRSRHRSVSGGSG